jgi:low affinity Fe/Cu permease
MGKIFTRMATAISAAAGRPFTAILAMVIVIVWAISGPMFAFSDTWQLVINTGTTIVTFLMVFLIQNTQNRDAAAMQAKLDEIIRSIEQARGQFIGIEHLTEEQIEAIRDKLESEIEEAHDKSATADDSVERLLERF